MKNLKKKVVSKVSEFVKKLNKDVCLLFTNIDAATSKNNKKILDLVSINLKILENMSPLHVDSLKEFTKQCDKIKISDEILGIIKAEISDWNSIMTNDEIAKIQTIDHKFSQRLLHVNDWNESLKIISVVEKLSDKLTKPILHWCQWQSNKVHYFDWYENSHKSITINGLSILRWSRSISINHNYILLCGGYPDDNISKTNKITSIVCKINIETRSFQTLKPMNTGRANFCITLLNGFYYILGGLDYQSQGIAKCERFSLDNDRWEDITDLNHPRNAATCLSITGENCIYIIGGRDHVDKLDETIEKYDAAFNNWILIQIPKTISSQVLGCCLLPDSNLILIFGGEDVNGKCKKECYFYNHKNNQVTDANPLTSDYNGALNMPVIFNNKIYCYFWKSLSNRELSTYNIQSGVWSIEL